MSRISKLTHKAEESGPDVIEVDIVVMCRQCGEQPDIVKYNTVHKLLFWACPNKHNGWIEDFEY